MIILYEIERGGTEQLLPVNLSVPTTTPLLADITYLSTFDTFTETSMSVIEISSEVVSLSSNVEDLENDLEVLSGNVETIDENKLDKPALLWENTDWLNSSFSAQTISNIGLENYNFYEIMYIDTTSSTGDRQVKSTGKLKTGFGSNLYIFLGTGVIYQRGLTYSNDSLVFEDALNLNTSQPASSSALVPLYIFGYNI